MNVKIRSFEEKDLTALVKLLNEARLGSHEYMPLTEEEVRSRIEHGKSRVLVAEDGGKVVGSVTYSDGYWGEEIRWLVVRRAPDQRVVEDLLVSEAEKLVRGETVFTSVDLGSPETAEWARRGYSLDGGLYQMVTRLEGSRAIPTVPEGIVLRSMRLGEEKSVVDVVNAVFGWERLEPNFVEKDKVESAPFNEEWVFLAESEGRILSVVVAWPAVKFNQFFGAKRGYLGPAATVPEYRSKRLASALTVRAMNFLHEKGMNTVVLHTSEQNVPSVALLRSIGFEVGHHIKFLRKKVKKKE
jgi:ribosomal protein S18 acetylase RimI-like enzyme